jgi:hypothetical protein
VSLLLAAGVDLLTRSTSTLILAVSSVMARNAEATSSTFDLPRLECAVESSMRPVVSLAPCAALREVTDFVG